MQWFTPTRGFFHNTAIVLATSAQTFKGAPIPGLSISVPRRNSTPWCNKYSQYQQQQRLLALELAEQVVQPIHDDV
jgi:hypothetical protein